MTDSNFDPTRTASWSRLQELAAEMSRGRLLDLVQQPGRLERLTLAEAGMVLDASKHLVDDAVLDALLGLARASPLASAIEAMFRGERINNTEHRPVLHTALRAEPAALERAGLGELAADVATQLQRMGDFSERLRSGQWLGSTGQPITDVVNLGIGGSDLGPRLAVEALKEFAHPRLRLHFVANVDGEAIRSTLRGLAPATTLVVVASKTFTTQETLLNAATAADWLGRGLGLVNPYDSPHFIGITANPVNAAKLGIPATRLLQFWDWVGGRYSLWSSIGFAISVAIGQDNFQRMLAGARAMDQHFRHAPWERNLPVMMALLGIWYRNFLGAASVAVIPYCERLYQLPFYLQQLDMESNGKGVTRDGRRVDYDTGPLVWGQAGTTGQHSFFQLLHQGTHLVPVDFIGVARDDMSAPEHHRVLLANMLAQSAALMTGKQDPALPSYRQYPGNRPSTVLLLDRLTPENFGALLALYEHKVFVQGCLWHINSFDQWGVELGKELANALLDPGADEGELDASTRAMLQRLPAVRHAT